MTLPIDSILLTRIKAQLAEFLTDTCTIERVDLTGGDYMSPAESWRVVASGTACRLITPGAQTGSAVKMVGMEEALEETYRIILPRTTDLQANDRITTGGEIYSVVRIEAGLTDKFFVSAFLKNYVGADHG